MPPLYNAQAVSGYSANAMRLVPGLVDLQRMAALLLAERVSEDGRVLVLGAGGGLELKRFAEMYPGWHFDGVDPPEPMLELAWETLGALSTRIALHQGYIDIAPEGPFDGAACLLTLHFLPKAERLATLRQLHRRLRPGAPLVVAHHSVPEAESERGLWLSRFGAFAASSGVPAEQARSTAEGLATRLPMLPPAEDEDLLADAGFTGVSLFYAALPSVAGFATPELSVGTPADSKKACPLWSRPF